MFEWLKAAPEAVGVPLRKVGLGVAFHDAVVSTASSRPPFPRQRVVSSMLSLESGPKRSRDEDTGGEVEDDGTTKGVMKAMHMNVDQSECEQRAHVKY